MTQLEQTSRWTADPAGTALQQMAATAKAAADVWTCQEWAGRLAARAGPRDYRGQLRHLYADVLERWRYTQEHGERVPGTPRALLGHVLGASYNRGPTCESPERCDLARTKWAERGFGDCDDVSTLIAAGALALGMRPFFRVVRWPGGAHVSTLVETPDGQRINLDPVGHPDHPFGWELMPAGGQVQLVPVENPTMMAGWETPTYLAGFGRLSAIDDPHVVLTRPGDPRGPRVLVIPTFHFRLLQAGMVEDGMPAVDQFGDVYRYLRDVDVWAPMGCCSGPMGRTPRHLRFGRRLRRGGRKLARFAQRIGNSRIAQVYRKAAGRLLRSPLVREAASRGLQALGVPPQATKAVLAREAALVARGGRAKVAELLARGKSGEAARLVASVTGTGLQAAMPGPFPMALSGVDDAAPMEFVLYQDGRQYAAAPVAGIERMAGWYGFGQLDVADTPTPGRYYRIKKGDTFFGIIGQAFNLKAGGARLKKTQQVNAVPFNRRLWRPAPEGEKKWFPEGRVSFSPRFACDATTQALSPTGGANEGCFGIIYIAVNGEDPPPFEQPPEPNLPSIPDLPDEPEEPTVVLPPVVPVPEEPIPEVPVPVSPEPVTPAPPVEPKPPTPTGPTGPTPEPPSEPDPGDYTVPVCPPGTAYSYQLQRCAEVQPSACPPGQYYDFQRQQCWPFPTPTPEEPEPVQPVQPVQPVGPSVAPRPAKGGGAMPLAILASVVTNSPVPLVVAALMEKRS